MSNLTWEKRTPLSLSVFIARTEFGDFRASPKKTTLKFHSNSDRFSSFFVGAGGYEQAKKLAESHYLFLKSQGAE